MGEIRRLFFGLEVKAPWPDPLPLGRKLAEENRHLTLAFLGDVPYPQVASLLSSFPLPPFKVGIVGCFDHVELLPPGHPSVISWHVEWQEECAPLYFFQKKMISWLQEAGFTFNEEKRPWLPHVTLCRRPFHLQEWIASFQPVPLFVSHIHLFESVGELRYQPLFSYPIKVPFEEMPHTADLAFKINGESLPQLFLHAKTALAFHDARFLLPRAMASIDSLETVIAALNEMIREIDQKDGCSFKAVAYHGEVHVQQDGTLQWEMIVDVSHSVKKNRL